MFAVSLPSKLPEGGASFQKVHKIFANPKCFAENTMRLLLPDCRSEVPPFSVFALVICSLAYT